MWQARLLPTAAVTPGPVFGLVPLQLFVGSSLCVKECCVCVRGDMPVDTHAGVGSLYHHMDSRNQSQVAGLIQPVPLLTETFYPVFTFKISRTIIF